MVDERIGHYTSLDKMKSIVVDNSMFRLYNVVYMNDPQEGDIINQIFDKHSIDLRIPPYYNDTKRVKIDNSNTYIGSFSLAVDVLPLWAQYGDGGKGCCIVLDTNSFDDDDQDLNEVVYRTRNSHMGRNEKKELYCLYDVRYIDIETMDYDIELNRVIESIKEIQEMYSELDYRIFSLINSIIDQIRYLYKSRDYEHEMEIRIVKYSINDVKSSVSQSGFDHLYIEMDKDITFKEIVLGPKVMCGTEIAPILYRTGKVRNITRSGIKYQ